jgi:hypothetical protein
LNVIIEADSQKHPCAGAFAVYYSNFSEKEVRIMPKITFASADYDDSLPIFGVSIIVHLDNTQILFFSLESKAVDPAYAVLREKKKIFNVKSDEESIYWPDGPRLTFSEIMEILSADVL